MDVLNGQNVHDPATWAYVRGLAGSGKVIAVIGGPPCRSVSRMLEKQPGPPRLRGRDGEDRFGLPMLTEAQQQKTDGDTAMFLKQLGLYVHAEESWNPETWPHMEHVKNRVGFSWNPHKTRKPIFLMGLVMNRPVFGHGMKPLRFWPSMKMLA